MLNPVLAISLGKKIHCSLTLIVFQNFNEEEKKPGFSLARNEDNDSLLCGIMNFFLLHYLKKVNFQKKIQIKGQT